MVAVGEELARALDTALPMLAVAGPENSVLEGFMLGVSVRRVLSVGLRMNRSWNVGILLAVDEDGKLGQVS